jgi:hypothetical protein
MKKLMKGICMLAACAVALSVMSCGSDDDEKTKDVPVTKIELRAIGGADIITSFSLEPGRETGFSVTSLPETATNKKYNWSSDNAAVASINVGGLLKAVAPGSTKVWCKAQDGSNVSASLDIIVKNIDFGEDVAGNYNGNLLINEGSSNEVKIPLVLKAEYREINKISFKTTIKLPAAALDASLAPLGNVDVQIESGILTVSGEDTGYYISGNQGSMSIPAIAMGTGLTTTGTIDNDKKINIKFDIATVGEAFFKGVKE